MAADRKSKEIKGRKQNDEQAEGEELRDEQLKDLAGGAGGPLGPQQIETNPGTGSGPQVNDSPS